MSHRWNNLFLFNFFWNKWRVIFTCLVVYGAWKKNSFWFSSLPNLLPKNSSEFIFSFFIHFYAASFLFRTKIIRQYYLFFVSLGLIFSFIWVLDSTQCFMELGKGIQASFPLIPSTVSFLLWILHIIIVFKFSYYMFGSKFIFPWCYYHQNIIHIFISLS